MMNQEYEQAMARTQVARVDDALFHLREARKLLADAGARKTLARVDLAISSAKGAKRNAGYRVTRAQMGRK